MRRRRPRRRGHPGGHRARPAGRSRSRRSWTSPLRPARLLHRRGGGGSAGRRGDFLTSPEVGPLFGAVLARYLDAVWERLDRPDPFTVVDAGAGPGTPGPLAARGPAGVRRRAALRGRRGGAGPAGAPSRRRGIAARPAGRTDRGRRAGQRAARQPAVPTGRPRRRLAGGVRDGGPGRDVRRGAAGALDPVPPVLPARAAHGARAPLQDAAAAWVDAAQALVDRGRVARASTTPARARWR